MPKIKLKQLFIMGMTVVSIYSFAGCSNPNEPDTQIKPNPPQSFSTSSSSGTERPEPKPTRVPVEIVENFINSLQKDYTLSYDQGTDNVQFQIDGDVLAKTVNQKTAFATIEGGKEYIYLEVDGQYHKKFAVGGDLNLAETQQALFDVLNAIEWKEYDEDNKIFYGTLILEDQPAQMFSVQFKPINNVSAELYLGKDIFITFEDIGTTNVTLPENVIDDTVVSDKIYENGKFNISLMNEVLVKWFKGDNKHNKDFVSAKLLSDNLVFDKIIFINPSLENLQVGFRYTSLATGRYYFRTADFTEENLYNGLKNGKISTTEELQTYLRGIHKGTVDTSSEIIIDPEMTQEDFNKMTTNIFNRLAEVGFENSIDSGNATKVEGLNPDDVMFGFARTKDDSRFGEVKWTHYYLIKTTSGCKWITIDISALTDIKSTANNNILDDDAKTKWYVFSCKEKSLDKDNANLHTANAQTEKNLEL